MGTGGGYSGFLKGGGAEVDALAAGEVVKAVARQGRSFAAVARAGPGERGIQIIAAVLKNGADIEPRRELFRAPRVGGPDRSGQAESGVLHALQGFGII